MAMDVAKTIKRTAVNRVEKKIFFRKSTIKANPKMVLVCKNKAFRKNSRRINIFFFQGPDKDLFAISNEQVCDLIGGLIVEFYQISHH